MSQNDETKPSIYPALKYRDGAGALEWLGKALGFQKNAVHLGPDGSVAHAEMSFGNGTVMLGSHGKPDPKNPWSTEPIGIYCYVADVDGHYRRAKAAGAEIVRELKDTDYGAREYSVRDLGGHLWSFGTYRP